MSRATTPLAPGAVYDRYVVESLIGSGGLSRVYLVRHGGFGTLHALKVLQHAMRRADLTMRLGQEGRIQANLHHPNIVAVTDILDVEGSVGLVMEYVAGFDLARLMRQGPLSWRQVDHLAQGILRGVAEAHRWGIVHRDLKPDNVLLQLTETDLVPKVADFGLAKLLAGTSVPRDEVDDLTRTGQIMGTPGYMSPEHVHDVKRVDERSDLYALGVMFFEMLAGRHPFAVSSARPPSALLPAGIPTRMADAIGAAWVDDRDDRIGSCEALLEVWMGETPGVWDVGHLRSLLDEAPPTYDANQVTRFRVVEARPTLMPPPAAPRVDPPDSPSAPPVLGPGELGSLGPALVGIVVGIGIVLGFAAWWMQ